MQDTQQGERSMSFYSVLVFLLLKFLMESAFHLDFSYFSDILCFIKNQDRFAFEKLWLDRVCNLP